MGAHVIFLDEEGRLLLVKPSYRDHWSIPGGMIEEGESPRTGAIREIKEEIGLDCPKPTFLSIDYISHNGTKTEALQFTFFGGVLNKKQAEAVKVDNKEIVDFKFLPIPEALQMFHPHMRSRMQKCLDAIETGTALYLENGEF
jgi:8-oxo-dGTP pyrophosphatase MutT (NUDIX family)